MNEKHDQDFWEYIVKLVEDGGIKLSVVLDRYQITRSSYYYWRKRLHRNEEEIEVEEDEQAKKNNQLHSSLGCLSPCAYKNKYMFVQI